MWSTDWDVVNAETERRERELIALKVYRNTLVPINRKLPLEIWSEIFIHRRNMSSLRRPYEWITLTQVCNYWRELILHNPTLWSHIHAGRDVSCNDYLPRILARSQRKALTVNIYIDDPLDSDAVEALSGEIHRVEHFNFCVSSKFRDASGISRNLSKFCSAASHAPEIRLKSLIVWGEGEHWAPRLTEIRLLLSPSILHLCLILTSFPAVEEARSALRSMPSLVALELKFTQKVSDYSESDVYCPPGEEIRLDRLGKLWLVGPPLLCAALISSLGFPASTSVTVGPPVDQLRYSDSQYLPLMDALLRKIQATGVSATRPPFSSMYVKRSHYVGYVTVDTWSTTHTSEILKDRPKGRMLDLVLPEDVALQLIDALGDLLKDVKSMFMSIYCDQVIARAWAGIVRRMINLRELMVVGIACHSLGPILAGPIAREEDSGSLNADGVEYAEIEEHLRANPTLLHLHALVIDRPQFGSKLSVDHLQRVLDARKALRMGPISTQVKVTDKEMQRIIRKDPNCIWVDGSYSFTYSVVSKPSAATPDEDEW